MAHTVRFIHDGDAIDYCATEAVAAGQVVVRNDLLGVAKVPIAAGALGALAVVGVFDFPKATGAGTAIQFGESVFWDEAEEVAKLDDESGANALIGQAVAHADRDDEIVRVRLSQGYVGNINDDTDTSDYSGSESASASA